MSAKYIAIVDDELDIVDLFKEALEMKGYYVILMSAYHDIECDPNFHFINKPITIPQLLQIVKDITSSS